MQALACAPSSTSVLHHIDLEVWWAGRGSEFLSHHVRALHTAYNCVIQWWKVVLPLYWNHVLLSRSPPGTIAALLHEIVNIYAVINPPNLTVCFGPLTALV